MRARGLTLVEVVVAVAILAALGLMTLQIYQVGLDAQRHSDVHELAYRNAMLGMEKVAGFVRGARVQLDEADGADPEVV
ncbi:MAG: prepilin-type N-terminal cleavage/methylation domain-containing protein, partial [Chloroflexi bacterium]|nr:prepilin-type N-terminal cleavage/methylation domain-containing protein [Chloroflexota bacterium]